MFGWNSTGANTHEHTHIQSVDAIKTYWEKNEKKQLLLLQKQPNNTIHVIYRIFHFYFHFISFITAR